MSKDDNEDGGGSLLQFPRVFLPGSFDAPSPDSDPGAEDGGQSAPAGIWPSLPSASEMAPPLALTMPGIPTPDDTAAEDEGGFVPPQSEDPANPTARDMLTLAMALVTAMGVAAAQGMWHRARQRQARADLVRAQADKAVGRGHGGRNGHGGGQHGGGSGGGGRSKKPGGLLTGSRQEAPHKKRHGGHTGPGKAFKGSHSRQGGSHKRPGSDHEAARSKRRRKKDKGGIGADGPCIQNRKPKPVDKKGPVGKAPKTPKGGKAVKGGLTPDPKRGPAPLKWKAAPKDKHGPGSDKAITTGKEKKRWTRTPDAAGPCVKNRKPVDKKKPVKPEVPKATKDGKRRRGEDAPAPKPNLKWKAAKKSAPGPEGDKALPPGQKRWTRKPDDKGGKQAKRRHARVWLTWESAALKRWRAGAATSSTAAGAPTTRREGHTSWTRRASSWARRRFWDRRARTRPGAGRSTSSPFAGFEWASARRTPPPPPPPGFEWMRPPPAADRSTRVTAERTDVYVPPQYEPEPAPSTPAVSGAPAGGRLALPVGQAPSSTSAPDRMNGATMTMPAPATTQYRDAELTIYDVIDADTDMAEEITAGVDEARATADGCEQLFTRLETVHAKIVELGVPGLLAGWMLRLMDKTTTVRARALAIAANLPAAAEAISIAGSNAAIRHQPVADITRDMGHVRPAEREYHDE